jgi:TonB family protein
MKSRTLFLTSFFLLISFSFCQAQDSSLAKVYTIVEEMPKFPPEYGDLSYYIYKNIQYPDAAFRNKIQGTVYVNFVVDTDGTLYDAKVLRGIGHGCDEEALRVVNAMPKWIAGKQNGNLVKVSYALPVEFRLQTKDALQARSRLHDYDPYMQGVSLIKQREFFKAVQEFDMAIAKNEFHIDAYYNRGVAKLLMRDTAAACRDWGLGAYYGDSEVVEQLDKICDSLVVVDADTFKTSAIKKSEVNSRELKDKTNADLTLAQFPGGESEMLKFFSRNLKIPQEAQENNISGRVYIKFYVSSKGKVSRPYVLRGVDFLLNAEALRVVKLMPDWKPGNLKGKPVPLIFNLPVGFNVK